MASLTANIHSNSDHRRGSLTHGVPPPPTTQYVDFDQGTLPPPPRPPHPTSAPATPISSKSKGPNDGRVHSAYNSPMVPTRPPLQNAPRSMLNQPQPASARGRTKNTSDSSAGYATSTPQEQQKTERRRSLIGFDPLLGDGSTVRSAAPDKPPPPPFENARAPSPKAAAPTKPLTPQPTRGQQDRSKQHRREVQSFCTSDLRDISKKASEEEEPKEQRSTSQERSSNLDSSERTPPTPKGSSHSVRSTKQTPPKTKNGTARSELFTISMSSRRDSSCDSTSPKENIARAVDPTEAKEDKISNSSNGISRRLQWGRGRSQKRTKSLETKEIPGKGKRDPRSASMHEKKDTSETKTSMYNSIVKDLMELSFDKLQLPTLAKPLPTSFLTGREGEIMRTCEYEAAPFQMEIPGLSEFAVPARLNEFVENYRRIDQNCDLQQWKGLTNSELRQVKIVQHIPIAQLLLECGDDVSIQGVVAVGSNADNRVEAIIFESQQHFTVVIRGTTEQQSKPCPKKTTNRKAVPMDAEHENVEVYQCFLDEYQKIEEKCFALLDILTEEHPFCDVVFTGHSFGAALTTLAAVRYSNARPMMRVKCYPMASPKVGFSEFRQMVNSSPNLRVMRLEYGQDGKCQLPGQGGSHVGHTLLLHGSLGHNSLKNREPVLAYKFDAPKHKKFKTTHPDLRSYVVALEEISRLNLPWAKDFVGTSGQGVIVNNEPRQMV